jgi:hypothetical protein
MERVSVVDVDMFATLNGDDGEDEIKVWMVM